MVKEQWVWSVYTMPIHHLRLQESSELTTCTIGQQLPSCSIALQCTHLHHFDVVLREELKTVRVIAIMYIVCAYNIYCVHTMTRVDSARYSIK